MTATEELLRLLDERGVEYCFIKGTKVFEWDFEGTDGEGSAHATEVDGGINMMACSLTPEQAVAATLGFGTCHIVKETKTIRSMLRGEVEVTDEKCSECGGYMEVGAGVLRNYCPNCGRRVKR